MVFPPSAKSFNLKETGIVTARQIHRITPTVVNLPPPTANVGLLGSSSHTYVKPLLTLD